MDRKLTRHLGLPTNDKMIASNKAKYIAKTKTWKCTLCDKTSAKYNRREIINRVSAKRNLKTTLKIKKAKGMHIENKMSEYYKWNQTMGNYHKT